MKSFLGLQLPLFMPDATLGAVRTLTTDQLERTGTRMIVVNTFHLLLTLGVEGMKKVGGISELMGWKGKVLSDSGGFQVFSLVHRNPKMGKITQYGVYFTSPRDGARVLLTPEISIDMQIAIGSDVLIVLDDCRGSDVSREDAEKSVENTYRWAERAKKHLEKNYPEIARERKLFAVVQGGSFEDLRKKNADDLMSIGFDGYCFGGWPIDTKGKLVEETLGYVAGLLPDDVPKYAMGIGSPEDIRKCVKLGYEMYDCVLPTRNARHGLLYTSSGPIRISKEEYKYNLGAVDPDCDCETCQKYSMAYIHHLFRSGEMTGKTLATLHNLSFYAQMMKELKV